MALDAGSIDVTDPENVTGTGLAFSMFQGAMSEVPAENLALVAASMKPFFEGLATAIVDALKNDAEITVTVKTTDVGLQTLPTPLVAGAPTDGPAADKTLTGTIT